MDDLAIELRKRKASLLTHIEGRIDGYIVSTGKNCIALVERDDNGTAVVRWDFGDDLDDLFKRIYRFMRKRRAPSGRELDSALTDPIVEIVKIEYQAFYDRETEAISQGLLRALTDDEIVLKGFLNRVTDIALKRVSSKAKKHIVDLVTHQIRESVSQGALHSVGHQVGHLATTTAGAQVTLVISHLLIKLLVANMGAIVAKVMASAALQQVLMMIAKKFVIAAVTGAFLNFLAIHFGVALAGASVMWIVLPIMAGYVGYKIHTFPKELGKAVSRDVRQELDRNFDGMNKTVLEKIFNTVFGSNELAQAIAKDSDFQSSLIDIGEKLDSGLGRFKGRDSVSVNVIEVKT